MGADGKNPHDEDLDAAIGEHDKEFSTSRFYEREYPEVDDLVMVQVTRVMETNAYVKLLEYDGKEGMILLAEVSAKRIRSIIKEIRVGQFHVCLCLKTEEDKGYIDLSKRRVNAEDRGIFLKKYAKSKQIHSSLRQLCNEHTIALKVLCEKIAWPIYALVAEGKFQHGLDAFKQYVNDGDDTLFKSLLNKPEDKPVLDSLLDIITQRLTPQKLKMKAVVEVKCYEYAGIEAVKAALLAGQNVPEEELGKGNQTLQIKVVAPPEYDVVATSMGKENGLKLIAGALERIKNSILAAEGTFEVKKEAYLVSGDDRDEEAVEEVLSDDGEVEDEDVEGMGGADIDESAFKNR